MTITCSTLTLVVRLTHHMPMTFKCQTLHEPPNFAFALHATSTSTRTTQLRQLSISFQVHCYQTVPFLSPTSHGTLNASTMREVLARTRCVVLCFPTVFTCQTTSFVSCNTRQVSDETTNVQVTLLIFSLARNYGVNLQPLLLMVKPH